MENIAYFEIIKQINGEEVVFTKYINTTTGELVNFDTSDECNFVETPNTRLNIKCAILCEELPCKLAIYNIAAPNPVVINSNCMSGGVINAPTTACPSGSTLEYSTDGVNWNDIVPMYDQTSAMTIYTRCVCIEDITVIGPITTTLTTPEICPPTIDAQDVILNFSNIILINSVDPTVNFSGDCEPITISLISGTEINCIVSINNNQFDITIIDNNQDFSFDYQACCNDGTTCDIASVIGNKI